MPELFEKAVSALRALPDEERESFCWEIIERLEDKSRWSEIVATPSAQCWLENTSKANLEIYKKQADQLNHSPITISSSQFQREPEYWKNFDELPKKLQKKAEENYHLWRNNPDHPSLRFKKVHSSRQIFSFRVGMECRTVGVMAPDGKMVWFWIGSVDHFEAIVSENQKSL